MPWHYIKLLIIYKKNGSISNVSRKFNLLIFSRISKISNCMLHSWSSFNACFTQHESCFLVVKFLQCLCCFNFERSLCLPNVCFVARTTCQFVFQNFLCCSAWESMPRSFSTFFFFEEYLYLICRKKFHLYESGNFDTSFYSIILVWFDNFSIAHF